MNVVSDMEIVKMVAGPCRSFRSVTLEISEICVTVTLRGLAVNASMVVWCPLCDMRKRRVTA